MSILRTIDSSQAFYIGKPALDGELMLSANNFLIIQFLFLMYPKVTDIVSSACPSSSKPPLFWSRTAILSDVL
jgi:hypothetical protein